MAGVIAGSTAIFVFFFVIGAFLRVLVGPVSLGPFNSTLADSVSNALPGFKVRYDEAAVEWSREEGRINLVVLGARVFDDRNRIIAQAPKAEIGLAAGAFIKGKIKVKRIALVGVQLNFVRTADGKLRLGVENDRDTSDALDRIRDAIEKGQGGAGSLQNFAVEHARLAFYDEATRLFVVAPDAGLQFATSGEKGGPLVADVDAQVEISGNRTHVTGEVKLPHKGPITGNVELKGLNLSSLAANSKSLSILAPFDLTTDLTTSFTVDGTKLIYADFGIDASGTVTGLGPRPMPVHSIKLIGRYDGKTGRLLIDDGSLAGQQAQAHLQGTGDLTFDASNALQSLALDITMDKVVFDMPEMMGHSVAFARAGLRANYNVAAGTIAIDMAEISGGPLSASMTGKITLAGKASPGIAVDAKLAPIGVRDLLHYWPLKLAGGPRSWIDNNVAAGRVGPVVAKIAILPGQMDLPALPDSAMTVTVPISDATITYLHGLTPMTNVSGTATLLGDTFKGVIASGAVGKITIASGQVAIPNLHIDNAPADIDAHIAGTLPDVLALIDEKPLQYPTRFHLHTQTARGAVQAELNFHVPTNHNVSIDQVGIHVKTVVAGLALALGEHTKITDGTATFLIDNNSLHATGPMTLGAVQMDVDWMETFKDAPITTHITAKGTLDDAAREAFGFKLGDFIAGPVGVVAQLQGRRGQLQTAQSTLDLTQASVGYDLINYKKAPGIAASGTASARFGPDGSVRSADFVINGPNLTAKGTATLNADGDLARLDAPVVKAGPLNDFGVTLLEGQTVAITITGHSFDGSALGKHNPGVAVSSPGQAVSQKPVDSNDPFRASVKVDRIVLQDGVALSPFALEISGIGHRPEAMSLSAQQSPKDKISGTLVTDDSGRHLALSADDAGMLMKGMFGMESVRGGTLAVTVKLPPLAQAARNDAATPDYTGTLSLRDFRVLNQNFLTRLFTAGSLEGFANLMRGEGVQIDKLDVPFTTHGDVIDIRDARASGPSIGITAEGYVDRRTNQLALKGALAPAYGINSVLGAIPLLGDVLVSKKGEGILGMTYSATGGIDAPEVSMNPLSVLTPGILRRIFEGKTPTAPAQANSTQPAPDNSKQQ
ncbi:MAG TPA: AsmA-like C-terminal domain-containing protein [Rhizomicrobium sp.]|jgi:hypothetical protein